MASRRDAKPPNVLEAAPVDPALIERFRRDLAAARGCTDVAGDRLALAVSGGPDSMAMLALAHAAFPGAVIAATVDHRLRPEAADEAAMVGQACARTGVPHAVLVPDAPIRGASVQAMARQARYALLSRWIAETGARWLLTAHHADDQAETFLMRAARGSGISGLGAIRARRELMIGDSFAVNLLRPLLGWRRTELRAVATEAGLPFVDDPSNADDAYDRTRFRALLEANPWLDVPAITRAAAHAAEADRALRICAEMLWDDRVHDDGHAIAIDPADLPPEILRRLAAEAIDRIRAAAGIAGDWRRDGLDRLLVALAGGGSGTIAEVQARAIAGKWHFRPAPPRRSH